jgi:uncharacterized membrane protein
MAASDRWYSDSLQTRHSGQSRRQINVGTGERLMSFLGGGSLLLLGLMRRRRRRLPVVALGGGLLLRGATGHSYLYDVLGINTVMNRFETAGVKHGQGIKIEKSVTINRPAEELYRFCRNFENLPHLMNHLKSVRVIDEKRSHWVAETPAGMMVEWDAEIINEIPNELIAWRSLENSQIPHAGTVRFEKAANGQETVVRVILNYDQPAGRLGTIAARLLGRDPKQQLEESLRRFKQIMEAGETPTVENQPAGYDVYTARPLYP